MGVRQRRETSARLTGVALAPPDGQPTPLAPLQERDYRLFFFGSLASNLGTFCQSIALSLLVYRLSQSTFQVGVVNFAQFAAVPLLAPFAGAAADRFDRRRILIVTQVAAFVVAAVLTLISVSGMARVWNVILLAGLLGVTSAVSFPVNRAFATSLVSSRNLGRAINLDSVSVNLARATGPVAGAYIVDRFGVTWAFAVNALSFLCLAFALFSVRARPTRPSGGKTRFRDSFGLLRRQPRLAGLLFIVACCAIAADPPVTLGPELAHRFGGGDRLAGLILGAFGAGGVLGAFVAGAEAQRHHRKVGRLLAVLVTGIALFALSGWLALTLLGALLGGFGYLTAQTRTTTLMVRSTNDAERGRVMALWAIAFVGVRPLASLFDGFVGSNHGVRVAALCMAAPAAVACSLSFLFDRQDRRASA